MLSDLGYVVHEVMFNRGSTWLIESEDLTFVRDHLGSQQ
jgi:hypothetical protein